MTLLTRWGAALDPDAVLPEYPRPQLARDSYLNLNGRWEYAFADEEPAGYDGEIIVPFSPESPLSGVGRQLLPARRSGTGAPSPSRTGSAPTATVCCCTSARSTSPAAC